LGAQISRVGLADKDDVLSFAVTPLLIAGNNSFFVGTKTILTTGLADVEIFDNDIDFSRAVPAIFVGTSIGDKTQFIPSANLYYVNDQLFVVFGIGINFKNQSAL
jgi:hypothetical protein